MNPKLVNVGYTPGDGAAPLELGQVEGETACAELTTAWYYDDPVKPKSISLCPATCAKVQADPKAKIEILLGCATRPAQ